MVFRNIPAVLFLLTALSFPVASEAGSDHTWHNNKEINQRLKSFSKSKRTSLESIGKSSSGADLRILNIHPVVSDSAPAILVVGNISGRAPLGSEAALKLIGEILDADTSAAAGSVRWFIIPAANPDGSAAFFAEARHTGGLNLTAVDEDRDGDFGEDPSEDINHDGLITTMLVPDPAGHWVISEDEPLLAVKADAALGQTGIYRKEIEGYDNDGDGLFNEDGPGGVNPGRNFPHRFTHWTNEGGRWAADQPETRAILEFAYDHPEIAMILVLDRVNNLRHLPEIDEAAADGKYPVPEQWASSLGVKPGQRFTMDQLKQLLSEYNGNPHVSAHQVFSYMEEGGATEVDSHDLGWWTAVSEEYISALDEAGLNGKRLPSAKSTTGSLEEWGYFQFGVPTFALDFWSVPLVAEADSTEEAEETEEDDSTGLSDKQKALLQYTAETKANQRLNDWTGLQTWESASLPDGQKVLIGGLAPFATSTPPAALVDSLLAAPIKAITNLPHWLPVLQFGAIELTARGSNVFELKVWLKNHGPIAYPTTQGLRTNRVPPIVVSVSGGEILEGRNMATLDLLPAHGSDYLRWLIRSQPGDVLKISASAPSLGTITTSVNPAAKGGRK